MVEFGNVSENLNLFPKQWQTAALFVVSMPIVYFNELLKIIEKSTPLEKTVAGIAAQAGYAAAGTAAGGLVMGPLGALIGGIMGAVYGYSKSIDYDNIVFALRAMSEKEKTRVSEQVQRLVGSASVAALTRYLSTDANRRKLLRVLSNYVHQN
ncbi:hypothetical protein GCK32_008048 [Trichostrongylus colubriformis]|uniref:Uncharacterized protein n=1 Tax=Trichostrongylus colubriformis TaxID=6319 RepID=A0AAN8IV31_TRICO